MPKLDSCTYSVFGRSILGRGVGSSDFNDNSCCPTEIVPKVIYPFSATINSDNFEFLPRLRLDFSFVELESC